MKNIYMKLVIQWYIRHATMANAVLLTDVSYDYRQELFIFFNFLHYCVKRYCSRLNNYHLPFLITLALTHCNLLPIVNITHTLTTHNVHHMTRSHVWATLRLLWIHRLCYQLDLMESLLDIFASDRQTYILMNIVSLFLHSINSTNTEMPPRKATLFCTGNSPLLRLVSSMHIQLYLSNTWPRLVWSTEEVISFRLSLRKKVLGKEQIRRNLTVLNISNLVVLLQLWSYHCSTV